MNKNIPFFDLKKQYFSLEKEITKAVKAVCLECAYSDGKYVSVFEKKFADYCSAKYAMGVDNGTSALHLAVRSLGIGSGDEVILPANTFIATAWGVSYTGAKPVFADCDKDTWEIDPQSVQKKITRRTKAIIGVHLYGQAFDVDEILRIAKKNNIFVIEDCAQAHGSLYKGKKVGGLSDIGCFSFYPSKNLGAYGEAGCVITNSKATSEKIRKLKNHGSTVKYYHDELGFNMRMDGIQAAILTVKLKYLDKWNKRRREIADHYKKQVVNEKIKFQQVPACAKPVYHLVIITTKDRGKLIKYLDKNKIKTGLHYPQPCHLQNAYKYLGYKKNDLPNVEYLASHCLSLPIYPEMTEGQVAKVIQVLNKY